MSTTTIQTTERLLLRTWTPEDAAAVFEIWGNSEVMQWVEGGVAADVASVRQGLLNGMAVYEKHGICLWAVVEKASGEVIGDCGFHLDEKEGWLELAYHFRRSSWGKGYATEAARACINWAAKNAPDLPVVAFTHPENGASEGVLKKLGMKSQGLDQGEKYFVLDRP